MTDHIPPQSVEMEQSVLGSMLISGDAIEAATDILKSEDFYREAHRTIYESILALVKRHEPVDIATVREELQRQEVLDVIGGYPYLTNLMHAVVTPSNAGAYAKVVSDKAALRRLSEAATRIHSLAHGDYEDIEAVMADCERAFTDASQHTSRHEPRDMRDMVSEAYDQIEFWERNKGTLAGIPTGLRDLDYLLRGLQPSKLIIVAARPGQGKSAFAGQIAMHAAQQGHPVLIATLEMADMEIIHRLIATKADMDANSIKSGYMHVDEWRRVGEACSHLSKLPMWIDDDSDTSMDRLKTLARRYARKGMKMLVVDYLQLVKTEMRGDNRTREIDIVAHGLKSIAKSLNIPVVALSQLNRKIDERPNHTPMLADLRESGGIEAEADVVLFPYNPACYLPADQRLDFEPMEFIVAKARGGMLGAAKAGWMRRKTEFVNLEKTYDNAPMPVATTAQPTMAQTSTAPAWAPEDEWDGVSDPFAENHLTKFFEGMPK